jgi:hypothetical protein
MVEAVIDRFEGSVAVLLVGHDEHNLNVPRRLLPHEAREGSWLRVELDIRGQFLSASVDDAETAQAKQRISEKLERLRRGEHLK